MASFRGPLHISSTYYKDKVRSLRRWRRCFPSATNLTVADYGYLSDHNVELISGAVRSLTVAPIYSEHRSTLTSAAFQHLSGLQILRFGSQIPADTTPASLCGIAPTLHHLAIQDVPAQVKAQWADLSIFSALETLELTGVSFTPTPATFRQLPSLKHLYFSSARFPSPDCWPLMGR